MKILNRTRTRTKDCVSVLLPFHLCLQVFFSIWTSVVFTHWGCDAAVVLWTGHRHYTTDTNRSPSLFIFRLSIHEKKNQFHTHTPPMTQWTCLTHPEQLKPQQSVCLCCSGSPTRLSHLSFAERASESFKENIYQSVVRLSFLSKVVHLKVTSVFFLKKFWRKLQWILQAEMYIYIFAFC